MIWIEQLFKLGDNNWVFYSIEKNEKGKYRLYFTKMIHGKPILKYDNILNTLETLETDTKNELEDILFQYIYQIKEGLI